MAIYKISDSNNSSFLSAEWWVNESLEEGNITWLTTAKPLSHPVLPSKTFRFVIQTGLCMPIALLGLVGNAISWIVLFKQRPRLTTTVLLMALAVADIIFLLMALLQSSILYLNVYTNGKYASTYWDYYHYLFITLYPSMYFIRMVDTWLTVLLTVDRFIAVYRPLHAQGLCTLSKAYRNMIILILFSLVFSLPRFFEYKLINTGYKFTKTSLNENMYYMVIYQIVLFSLIMYIIPMILLVVLNAKLLSTLRHAETYRASLPTRTKPARSNNRSVTTIVVVVVATCIISNIVAITSHMFYSLEHGPQQMKHLTVTRRYLSNISNLFITINCSTNFLIYCLCSRNFRMVLVRTFRCYFCFSTGFTSGTSSGSMRTNSSGFTNNFSLLLRGSTNKKPHEGINDGATTRIIKAEHNSML